MFDWGISAGALWLAPLLGGAVDRPYALLVVTLCAVAAAARLRTTAAAPSTSYAGLGLALALGLCFVQLVPLPPSLRAWLAPGSDADLRQILHGLTKPGTWLPLSLDAPSTLNEAACLAGMLCLLLTLPAPPESPSQHDPSPDRETRSQDRKNSMALAVLAAAATVAGLGLLAALGVALPSPVGVPGQGTTRALLPAGLHNANHMAALCGMGALLALAWPPLQSLPWTHPQAVLSRLLWVLCNVALVGTLSRAGILSWGIAQALLVVLLSRHGTQDADPARRNRRSHLLWLVFFALALLLLYSLLPDGATQRLTSRFSLHELRSIHQPGSKVVAWLEALPILRGHLILGIGHGAGENIFQHSQSLAGRMRFVYLENQWLQLIFDFGVAGGVPLLTMLALFARDALRQRSGRDPLWLAAGLGLAALAVHNLFDFNAAVLGVSLPALVLVSIVEVRRFALPRRSMWALVAVTLILVLFAFRFSASHDEEGATIRQLASRPETPLPVLIQQGEGAMRRHPFDSHIPALVAARLVQGDHPDARTWLNRALLANPRDTLALQETARLLAKRGHTDDALLFLRQAIQHGDDADRRRSLRLLSELATDAQAIRTALPLPSDVDALLDEAGALPTPRWTLIADVARAALDEDPHRSRAAYWLGRSALTARDGWAARQALSALLASPTDLPVLVVADLIDLLGQLGPIPDADRLARDALRRSRAPEWLLALATLDLRKSPADRSDARTLLREVLDRLDRSGEGIARSLVARAHELLADVEEGDGNVNLALSHRQSAAALRTDASPAP